MLGAVEGLATIVVPLLLAALVEQAVVVLALLEHRHLMELLALLEQPTRAAAEVLARTQGLAATVVPALLSLS
jgi:hypothetical protein